MLCLQICLQQPVQCYAMQARVDSIMQHNCQKNWHENNATQTLTNKSPPTLCQQWLMLAVFAVTQTLFLMSQLFQKKTQILQWTLGEGRNCPFPDYRLTTVRKRIPPWGLSFAVKVSNIFGARVRKPIPMGGRNCPLRGIIIKGLRELQFGRISCDGNEVRTAVSVTQCLRRACGEDIPLTL